MICLAPSANTPHLHFVAGDTAVVSSVARSAQPAASIDGNMRNQTEYNTTSNARAKLNKPQRQKARVSIARERQQLAQPPAPPKTPSKRLRARFCRRRPSPRVFLPLVLALASWRLARPAPAPRPVSSLLVLVQRKFVILLPTLTREEEEGCDGHVDGETVSYARFGETCV